MATLSIPQLIQNVANAIGVPAALAIAVAQQESGLNQGAVGSKGEIGLFQLMPSTAQQLGVDPTDPAQNAQGGIAYLQQLYQQFGDWATALTAYNWGPSNVARYGAAAAPSSTQQYVASILTASGLGVSQNAPAGVPSPVASASPDNSALLDTTLWDAGTPTESGFSAAQLFILTAFAFGAYFLYELVTS